VEKSTTYPSLRRGEILSVECIIACVRCVIVRKAVDGRSGLNLSFFLSSQAPLLCARRVLHRFCYGGDLYADTYPTR
jgi:hypothetical protein